MAKGPWSQLKGHSEKVAQDLLLSGRPGNASSEALVLSKQDPPSHIHSSFSGWQAPPDLSHSLTVLDRPPRPPPPSPYRASAPTWRACRCGHSPETAVSAEQGRHGAEEAAVPTDQQAQGATQAAWHLGGLARRGDQGAIGGKGSFAAAGVAWREGGAGCGGSGLSPNHST